jgi:hypothetical protein
VDAEATAIAETVAAEVNEEDSGEIAPTATKTLKPDTNEDDEEGEKTPSAKTATPSSTPEDDADIGDDVGEFISDVTIPDYSEIETGEEITKTWRVKNAGTTTWTKGYLLEFEKGEKLGANTQIALSEEVKPGEMVDISIDFKVPTATGEFGSYWILKNEDNERVGVEGDGKYLSLYMIIVAVNEGDGGDSGGTGGSASIAGGAKITGASVSVDKANYSGACPAQLKFSYTVTTSNAGKVEFNLVFKVISPSGYKFDPAPQYLSDFTGGYTVYYDYTLFSNDPVTATARVRAVGSNEFLSDPVQFSIKCD